VFDLSNTYFMLRIKTLLLPSSPTLRNTSRSSPALTVAAQVCRLPAKGRRATAKASPSIAAWIASAVGCAAQLASSVIIPAFLSTLFR
jgi:hypothetical protein